VGEWNRTQQTAFQIYSYLKIIDTDVKYILCCRYLMFVRQCCNLFFFVINLLHFSKQFVAQLTRQTNLRVKIERNYLPGIFRLSSHWLPMCVTSAASFWRTIRSVTRPDGSPPIATRKGLPTEHRVHSTRDRPVIISTWVIFSCLVLTLLLHWLAVSQSMNSEHCTAPL